jgi:hypothetical protein
MIEAAQVYPVQCKLPPAIRAGPCLGLRVDVVKASLVNASYRDPRIFLAGAQSTGQPSLVEAAEQ